MAVRIVEGRRRAWLCEAFGEDAGAKDWQVWSGTILDTPPGLGGRGFGGGKFRIEQRQIAFTSRGDAICWRRNGAINKKLSDALCPFFGRVSSRGVKAAERRRRCGKFREGNSFKWRGEGNGTFCAT
jgi:hypothetical protein